MAHVLIADDITISRETLARVLRDAGHRVTAAGSGPEAVERARAERPDAAILDLNMPRGGGLQAAGAIKSEAAAYVPILILSGQTLSPADWPQILTVAEDYIRKPFVPVELCARLDVWLRVGRALQDQRRGSSTAPRPALTADGGGGGRVRGRAMLLERLSAEWRRALRSNEPFALLLCGAGPQGAAGPELAGEGGADGEGGLSVCQRVLRHTDGVGVLEGGRLAALLSNTPPAGALRAAERLRDELRKSGAGPCGVGLALVPGRDLGGAEDLLRAAERAVERACAEGAWRLCLHQHQGFLVRAD